MDAVAVGAGRILAAGTNTEVGATQGAGTRVIDLKGRTAIPGLVDAHFHLAYFGMTSGWLSLAGAASVQDIIESVKEAAASKPRGAWIYGRGWDPAALDGGRAPTLVDLDSAAVGNPVLLARADGHLCVANSEALRRAAVTESTPDPMGGHIVRNSDGSPTGELSERALYLAWDAMMAELGPADFHDPIRAGAGAAARAGVTTAHAIFLENIAAELEALFELDDAGELPIRVNGIVPVEALESLPRDLLTRTSRMARIGGAKIFADGTLFASTAALRRPYADSPQAYGEDGVSFADLLDMLAAIRRANLQPAIHAVGDRMIERILDALESTYGVNQCRMTRPRIEHAVVLAPDLLSRARHLGVVLSLQSRRRGTLNRRLGAQRAAWANPWQALASGGQSVVGGSDAPFIMRTPGAWDVYAEAMSHGLDFRTTLRMLATGAAHALSDSSPVGLCDGAPADITVLSGDPESATASDLREIRPVMTIVDGVVVYDDEADAQSERMR